MVGNSDSRIKAITLSTLPSQLCWVLALGLVQNGVSDVPSIHGLGLGFRVLGV